MPKNKYYPKKTIVLAILPIFAGCSWIYPEYNKPNLKINTTWSVPNSGQTTESILQMLHGME